MCFLYRLVQVEHDEEKRVGWIDLSGEERGLVHVYSINREREREKSPLLQQNPPQ